MNITNTIFEGVFIIESEAHSDDRGFFERVICHRELNSINPQFVQVNHSYNKQQGTFRGLHFQYPPFMENKLVKCISGAIVDIVVDLRKNSDTYLKHLMVNLTEENCKSIYIPHGFAHGFLTLKPDTHLIYFHSEYYTPNHEGALNLNDPALEIQLPKDVQVISEKDKNTPFIQSDFEGL
ncbi:dTDP-4-dehydrorhamnose 3,5-epimerase [Marinoscillum furvescens]|uniref:dTDP-4-dehydrorhamnose 3,5-epimerase n=1 Tax=Marinoscillum furvescens DSM 4134 TaxID=1122208 RepID=A0A3D9L0S3_MARFU|nr:dTDP-4-dehydrorhamnose 3,5-epimerase [Marinoscillum furvescens]RED96623.1 dTDP-4-dehydrorhamnose 3,5-epimerase [Marinoscillum furvescens DSM 4134]